MANDSERATDGRSRLDAESVRSRMARVALECEVIDVTPGPYGRVVSSDYVVAGTAELVDLAGPAGLLPAGEEHAAANGMVEWSHRFAQGTSIYGGTTDIQRNLIAEQFLG